ncbi:MAG: hypothetical protein U5K33_09180 [Halofilum sp. (in: g-proteobacteria)]|nr:hypothetical protein [Halofilum sp. (in: g-proteobacteria)]
MAHETADAGVIQRRPTVAALQRHRGLRPAQRAALFAHRLQVLTHFERAHRGEQGLGLGPWNQGAGVDAARQRPVFQGATGALQRARADDHQQGAGQAEHESVEQGRHSGEHARAVEQGAAHGGDEQHGGAGFAQRADLLCASIQAQAMVDRVRIRGGQVQAQPVEHAPAPVARMIDGVVVRSMPVASRNVPAGRTRIRDRGSSWYGPAIGYGTPRRAGRFAAHSS